MEQEQIDYSDIINLGFKENVVVDRVYFKRHGYNYSIITYKLTKKLYLDWEKDTRLCTLVRLDSAKSCNIMAKMSIRNLEHLKEIITFFSDDCGVSTTIDTGSWTYAPFNDSNKLHGINV